MSYETLLAAYNAITAYLEAAHAAGLDETLDDHFYDTHAQLAMDLITMRESMA